MHPLVDAIARGSRSSVATIEPRNANGAAEAMQDETILPPALSSLPHGAAAARETMAAPAVEIDADGIDASDGKGQEEIDRPRVRRKATIARRPKDEAALADQSCTPKWLADRLPPRDFDPCSGPRSHVRATVEMSLENGADGLSEPWIGAGFQNNPFSAPLAWMQKATREIEIGNCRDLIVLCKHDPGTAWWHALVRASSGANAARFARVELWMFHKRIQYDEHPELIERRRLERIAKAMRDGERDPEVLARITGKSSANFCSAIVHHRGIGYPMLALDDVADRWVTP